MHPNDQDFGATLEVVRHMSDEDPPVDEMLQSFNRFMHSDAAVMISFDGAGRTPLVHSCDADPAAAADYIEHFHLEDVMMAPYVPKAPGVWLDTDVLLPQSMRGSNRYYVDFMCKHRMPRLYSLILEYDDLRVTSIGFQQSRHWDGLASHMAGDRARLLTNELTLAIQRKRTQGSSWLAVSDQAFDALGEASCLVSASGWFIHGSPAAKQILDLRRGLLVRDGRLHTSDPSLDASLGSILRAAANGGVHRVSLRSGGSKVACMHAEAVLANPAVRLGAESLIFIRLRPEAAVVAPAPEVLCEALGVTIAEAKVLHALSSGMSPAVFAEFTGTSVNTVRRHIANLMSKLYCTRQADLVRTALQVRH